MNCLNWDGLRYFSAAAKAGSLSAAAKMLDSNQSTVSRHIDVLEKALDTTLFQRSVKGLRLTEQGQVVFEQAQCILGSVRSIQRLVHGEKATAKGIVRLSLPEGLGQEVLVPALDAFYQQHPEIKLVFNMSATTAGQRQGDTDISVRLFQPEEPDLLVTYLGEMGTGLYASEKYKKNYGLPSKLKDVRTHRVITYGEQLAILPENQWLLNHSSPTLRVLYSDSTVTRFKAAVSGIGLSLQPKILAQTNDQLIQLFKSVKLPSHKVWMVYHRDVQYTTRIRATAEFISSCIGDMLQ